ncbi:uncharacterized protein LOC119071776 isoform X1 [Bradysia coprophila]|uniref:uncharacterized protein LOC119071776 isoform X1 n=1 Tax=Bradysia coprophila TaxID=38358 RepID=UPI00187DB292|nr:uncharacterized protein LOC119071776 isoform X1 [Bradysia coprophila]
MNKTTLVNKYLDCAKLLNSEPLPDNLSEILIDVIGDTKLFADKLILVRSGNNCDSNAGVQERRYNTRSKLGQMTSPPTSSVVNTSSNITELKPRVIVKRLVTLNGIGSIQDGIQHETETRTTSELPDKVETVKPPTPVRRLVRRMQSSAISESDSSDSSDVNHETGKRQKSETPETANLKPPAPERRVVRLLQSPRIIESDSSDCNEVNLETRKRPRSEVPEKLNLKPPVPVRRIVRRTRPSLRREFDSSDSSEVKLETLERAPSKIPRKVILKPPAARRIVGRRNTIHSLVPNESDCSDFFEVNLFNRGLHDGCVIC